MTGQIARETGGDLRERLDAPLPARQSRQHPLGVGGGARLGHGHERPAVDRE